MSRAPPHPFTTTTHPHEPKLRCLLLLTPGSLVGHDQINFPELFLDGARKASGMQINNVMGVTIGPGGYFLNFTEFGLQINAGEIPT